MKKILIADDNPISRELVTEVLGEEYVVIEATDGISAIDRFQADLPDLALIDIQMPHLDGFAVLQSILEDARSRNVPVIALTAFAMEGDRERALLAGFNAYITKPIDVAALRTQVRTLLDTSV